MTDHVMASTAPNSLEEGSNSEVEEHQNLLSFRPIQQSDRDQLKALHEELFPVKYTEEFYNNVVKNKSLGGSPLYSRIAVWNRHQDPGMEIQNDLMEQLARYVDVHVRVFLDLELEDSVILSDSQGLSSLQDMESGDADEIMSCIIGGFVKCNEMKDRSIAAALIRNMYTHPRMFYIMTLGNTMRFRKQRLGTKMIYDCLTMIEKVPTCGAVYLHVITHNTAAIKFYEKLGFYRIEEIEGKRLNCQSLGSPNIFDFVFFVDVLTIFNSIFFQITTRSMMRIITAIYTHILSMVSGTYIESCNYTNINVRPISQVTIESLIQ
jgi:hypothetical protein